jgi:hypothetical protein
MYVIPHAHLLTLLKIRKMNDTFMSDTVNSSSEDTDMQDRDFAELSELFHAITVQDVPTEAATEAVVPISRKRGRGGEEKECEMNKVQRMNDSVHNVVINLI